MKILTAKSSLRLNFWIFKFFEACCCRRASRIFLPSFWRGNKLENPRICEAEQHLFMLTMKTCILSILIAVLIHCLTGKFNMDLPFLCWEFECYWKYYPRYIILKITEHVGEHCHEETEKYKTHSFRYSKFDCRAKDSIFLITWLDCILQFPLLDTKDVTNCRQMTEFCG